MNRKQNKNISPVPVTIASLLFISVLWCLIFGWELRGYRAALSGTGDAALYRILLWISMVGSLVLMFLAVSISALRREHTEARLRNVSLSAEELGRKMENAVLFSGEAGENSVSPENIRREAPKGREYRLKYYLNASHYVTIGGERGPVHPHTWEFALTITADREELIRFSDFDAAVESIFKKYRNRVVNDLAPFDSIMPTIENLTDYLAMELKQAVKEIGGTLLAVDAGETPTRTYRVYLN